MAEISLKDVYDKLVAKGGFNSTDGNSSSLSSLHNLVNAMNTRRNNGICNGHSSFGISDTNYEVKRIFNKLDSIKPVTCTAKLVQSDLCSSEVQVSYSSGCECNTRTACVCNSRTYYSCTNRTYCSCNNRTGYSQSCECKGRTGYSACNCNSRTSCSCNGRTDYSTSCSCDSRTGDLCACNAVCSCNSRASGNPIREYLCTSRANLCSCEGRTTYNGCSCEGRTANDCTSRTNYYTDYSCTARTSYYSDSDAQTTCDCNSVADIDCQTRTTCVCNNRTYYYYACVCNVRTTCASVEVFG